MRFTQAVGYEACMLIPQTPAPAWLAISIYPLSPQVAAQEFLTIQYLVPDDTP